MQRLFSTFPASWPGLGLLVLRITIAVAPFLALSAPACCTARVMTWLVWPSLAVLSMLVLVGFATPLATPLLAFGFLVLGGTDAGPAAWLALGGASLSLVMLGPGAWSLDARRYGRKRVAFDDE